MSSLTRTIAALVRKCRGPDCLMVTVTITIIPTFYLAEICYVLPIMYEQWSFWYNFHFGMSLFLMHNIVANLAQGLQGPGNVRDNLMPIPTQEWRHCATCDCMAPPRSWHCRICEVCVFKRDHHCNFFGCCIGYFNFRYFYMFVFYVFLSTLYAFVFNSIFFRRHLDLNEFSWLSAFSFLFPFASLVISWSMNNCYILLMVVNVLFTVFTGYLFYFHSRLLIRGITVGESKHIQDNIYDRGWKNNIKDAFGQRWYLVWLSGLIHSPLLGGGTYWKSGRD